MSNTRYKPVILQEHDAESRRLRAILDTETEEIYVYKLTKQTADFLGITIEEVEVLTCENTGEISDGYHTFNQLYHQRAVLFATIVNQNKDKSWKSFKHSDGKYCFDSNGEWFIVGIDTPQGSYTYHYAKEYWDIFDCQELECGKEWDGHTEEDVIRLLSLKAKDGCDICEYKHRCTRRPAGDAIIFNCEKFKKEDEVND